MSRVFVVLALVLGSAVVSAQPSPAASAPAPPPTAVPAPTDDGEAPAGYVIEEPRTLESLSQKEVEREMQQQQWSGPSGFWTSPHKSPHGAYRWRMLAIGLVLIAITGFFTIRLIRRTPSERANRGFRAAK